MEINKINRDNYEIFFLDYLDGSLSKDDIDSLLIFLNENLDLKEEFNLFISNNITLKSDKTINFGKKDTLKTSLFFNESINLNNYETFFIAYLEGDLSEIEKKSVLNFLENNPSLIKSFEQFEKAILIPDHSIVYKNKLSLKHKTKYYRTLSYSLSAIAAVFVLFFLFKTYFNPIEKPQQQEFTKTVQDTSYQNSSIVDNVIQISDSIETKYFVKQELPVSTKTPKIIEFKTSFTLTKIEPVSCNHIAFDTPIKNLEYRNEAEQLAFEMELQKILSQTKEIQKIDSKENSKNIWTSLFRTAEKTAETFGYISNN